MRKRIYFFTLVLLFLTGQIVNAQVTIGSNDDPNATLQVVGSTTNSDAPAGIIAPRVTVAQLNTSAGNYTNLQNGAIVYVTDATGAAGKTVAITATGYYYYSQPTTAAGEWKALGGSTGGTGTAGQDIRGKVKVVTQPTYTVEPDVYAIISNHSSAVSITFPDLTAADAGRVVFYYNNNTVALANAINNVTGQIGVNLARGGTFMWTGTQWFFIGK